MYSEIYFFCYKKHYNNDIQIYKFIDGSPCIGVDGVIEAYHSVFDRVTLSGPTVFSTIIQAATSAAEVSGIAFAKI